MAWLPSSGTIRGARMPPSRSRGVSGWNVGRDQDQRRHAPGQQPGQRLGRGAAVRVTDQVEAVDPDGVDQGDERGGGGLGVQRPLDVAVPGVGHHVRGEQPERGTDVPG